VYLFALRRIFDLMRNFGTLSFLSVINSHFLDGYLLV
jgi:hypothetical protein